MIHPLAFTRSIVSAAVVAAASNSALAADAVPLQNWDNGAGNVPSIGAGDSLSVLKQFAKSNYSGDPGLAYSAWAHVGGDPWWAFELTAAADTTIRLAPETDSVAFKPGLTVWASGNEKFDGGQNGTGEASSVGFSTPHSFNAVGQLGEAGTYWMSGDGATVYSNMKETLAYGVTGQGQSAAVTGWGESIQQGVHDVSATNLYEQGVAGSSGSNWIELSFAQMQPGWYVVFAGGTDHSLTAQNLVLSVSAVPEPQTWLMLSAGLLLAPLLRRRKRPIR